MKNLLLIFGLIFSQLLLAQSNERDLMQKQIEEMMRRRNEMIKSLFNDDDNFDAMEKRMMDMMKRFDDDDFNLGASSFFGGSVVGEYDWKEDEQYKTLSIKVKQIKDRPLDIKIEKGMIKIKGDVEEVLENGSVKKKRISKVHFERSFSIPAGVDEKNPQFENKDGELLIKFKKIAKSNVKSSPRIIPKNENKDRIPVMPDKDDVSL